MMDRTEQAGLGVAIVGHVALFGALSLGLLAAPRPDIPTVQPVDIQLVDEVGLKDTAPDPSRTEPAPSAAPEIGSRAEAPEDAPPEPAAVREPAPAPRPVAKAVTPAPASKPAPAKPSSAKPAPSKSALQQPRRSRLGADFLKGISDRPTASTSEAPRAAVGPVVAASLGREVLRQLKPFWKAPTGADAELLQTDLRVTLARDGSVTDVTLIGTNGVNESNRSQVRLHQEAAMKAVRLASPFTLPAEYYDAWKTLERVGFNKRLSQ